MKYLFFDTETTGPDPHTARPVQLAWLLASAAGETLIERSNLIIPDGFAIPAAATAVHGITTDRAVATGIPFNSVTYRFNNSLFQANYMVCHNLHYDFTVLTNEMKRRDMRAHAAKLYDLVGICTMKQSTNYCRLPHKKGRGRGYKWPRLQELHEKLFGEPFENAHDALADVKATARCFFELKKLNVL
ncbi:MAG TPA: 3'-5' exonuclease [Bacteroidetes bacterium]|nr:3'-5' exonuclease [Bacteroidota bacterium]